VLAPTQASTSAAGCRVSVAAARSSGPEGTDTPVGYDSPLVSFVAGSIGRTVQVKWQPFVEFAKH
jgi:hypothetical protein